MSRLIDADELIKKMLRDGDTYTNDDIRHGYHNCQILVYDAPTVDAEPVIRCKDCIYWCECRTKDKFPYKKDSCNKFGTKMNADDFCSRGERKDER